MDAREEEKDVRPSRKERILYWRMATGGLHAMWTDTERRENDRREDRVHRLSFGLAAVLQTGCLFLCLPPPVSGQDLAVGWRACEAEPPGSAVVRGQLIPQDGRAVARRSVRITEVDGPFTCSVRASEEGNFGFRGVPTGTFELTIFIGTGGWMAIQEIAPIPFSIGADTLVRFAVPIHADDPLARCMTIGWCASLMSRRSSRELTGGEEEELRVLGYRLAMVMSQQDEAFGPDWAVCLEDTEEVLEALREAFPNVVPWYECELRETQLEGWSGPRRILHHLPTDRPARSLSVDRSAKNTDTEAGLSVSFYVGPLWGAGFDCLVEATGGVWLPRSCRMTWIS
jgi:hypothetical protein